MNEVAASPQPAAGPAGPWFIAPENRIGVIVPFMLAHLVLPTINLILVQAVVASGATGANLGFLFLVNNIFWGVIISAVQAFVLRRHVPAISWFSWTAGSILAVGVLDTLLTTFALRAFGIDALSYYRFALPILRWLVISSAQWMVLDRRVRSAGLWIGATVFAIALYVVLQNAVLTAGFGSFLVFPWGGLIVGGAQSWCLLQFRSRELPPSAVPAP